MTFEPWMYLLYAFVQGIITTRFLKEGGGFVLVMMLFAPFVSVIWLLAGLLALLEFLVRYKN